MAAAFTGRRWEKISYNMIKSGKGEVSVRLKGAKTGRCRLKDIREWQIRGGGVGDSSCTGSE